jgi:hypothetical protein
MDFQPLLSTTAAVNLCLKVNDRCQVKTAVWNLYTLTIFYSCSSDEGFKNSCYLNRTEVLQCESVCKPWPSGLLRAEWRVSAVTWSVGRDVLVSCLLFQRHVNSVPSVAGHFDVRICLEFVTVMPRRTKEYEIFVLNGDLYLPLFCLVRKWMQQMISS